MNTWIVNATGSFFVLHYGQGFPTFGVLGGYDKSGDTNIK